MRKWAKVARVISGFFFQMRDNRETARPQPEARVHRKIALLTLVLLAICMLVVVVWPTVILLDNGQSVVLIAFLVIFRLNAFFLLFHVLGYWLYRCVGGSVHIHATRSKSVATIASGPHVSIVVPIRDEPVSIVRRMLLHIREIEYDNYSVFIVHNGDVPTSRQFSELLVEAKLQANVIHKKDLAGYKGGALNTALYALPENAVYVLVLDVDHAPRPLILQSLVPILQQDDRLAFVQAPQRHENAASSLISTAYCYKSRVFYDHLCAGMAATKSLFFTGTNALFRKAALDEIGGFDEASLTEDIRTSLNLHARGWLGDYYSGTVAIGYAPFDLYSYYRQQRRWAIGTFQNCQYALRLLLSRPGSLSIEQWILYLGWSGTFYLQGVTCNFLLLSSIVLSLTDVSRWMGFTDGIAL